MEYFELRICDRLREARMQRRTDGSDEHTCATRFAADNETAEQRIVVGADSCRAC